MKLTSLTDNLGERNSFPDVFDIGRCVVDFIWDEMNEFNDS